MFNSRSSNVKRRAALAAIGTLAMGGVPKVAARKIDRRRTVLLKGNHNNPINKEKILSAIKPLIKRSELKSADGNNGVPVVVPNTGKMDVLSYLCHIRDDSVPVQYVGTGSPKKTIRNGRQGKLPSKANNNFSETVLNEYINYDNSTYNIVEKKHKVAEEYRSHLESGRMPALNRSGRVTVQNEEHSIIGSQSITTADTGTFIPDSEWGLTNTATIDVDEPPFGRLIQSNWFWQEGGLVNGESYYAVGSQADIIPGSNEYDSLWGVFSHAQIHDWTVSGYANDPARIDRDPTGGYTGTLENLSASVSRNNIGISWSYSQPDLERIDLSNSEKAHWTFGWNNDYYSSDQLTFASVGDLTTSSPGAFDPLVEIDLATGWFALGAEAYTTGDTRIHLL